MIDVDFYMAKLEQLQAEGTKNDVKKFLQELYDFGWDEGYSEAKETYERG